MASHRPIPGPGSGSGSSSSSGVFPLNFPFGDTTYTKVFVGGLAWETKNEALRRHFEQYGEILEAVVITDKSTGRSKGYGFVTFRHPDSARRACVDPSPVIDGRRANCNLASRGRPWATPPHVRMRPASPFFGGASVPRGAYVGSPAYPQTFPYYYQQGFPYPSYGYTPYGLEFAYPQNARNPYPPQQYVFQGVPGTVDPAVYSFGQFGQPLPSVHGLQGYSIPGNQNLIQFSRPNISGVAPVSVPVQASYPPGLITAQPQFMVPVPPQLPQGSGSH